LWFWGSSWCNYFSSIGSSSGSSCGGSGGSSSSSGGGGSSGLVSRRIKFSMIG